MTRPIITVPPAMERRAERLLAPQPPQNPHRRRSPRNGSRKASWTWEGTRHEALHRRPDDGHRYLPRRRRHRMSAHRIDVCVECGREMKIYGRGLCGACWPRLKRRGLLDDYKPRDTTAWLEDVEWMAVTGETWEGAATRLGVKERSISERLRHNRRLDIANRFDRNSGRDPREAKEAAA